MAEHIFDFGREVVLTGQLGTDVAYGLQSKGDDEAFDRLFELDSTVYLAKQDDDFLNGIPFVITIVRRADGARFGCAHLNLPDSREFYIDDSNVVASRILKRNGIEPNEEFDGDGEFLPPFAFLPVKPFQQIGYAIDHPEA